jgi:hypothetical protein
MRHSDILHRFRRDADTDMPASYPPEAVSGKLDTLELNQLLSRSQSVSVVQQLVYSGFEKLSDRRISESSDGECGFIVEL